MHVIPWKLLSQGVVGGATDQSPDANVTISNKLFRLLIEAAMANVTFDERSYLAANPDVAEAIRSGKIASGRQHYLTIGYYEGRDTGYAGFDEAWYLQRYADVLLAVKRGDSASGLEHFRGPGHREWRSPNRTAEADIARWRSIIQPPKAGAEDQEGEAPAKTAQLGMAVQAARQTPPARRGRAAAA